MTDRRIDVLAVAVFVAALLPWGSSRVGWVAALIAAFAAWWLRRPGAFVVLCALAASLGAGAAWGEVDVVAQRTASTTITLAGDPEPTAGGVRVLADVDGRRIQLTAWGGAAGHLRPRLMGEVVTAEVRLRPLAGAPRWRVAQGVEGRGTVVAVHGWTEGRLHTRVANSLRRTIESGARSMSRSERSLFTGLVYGDDRQQQPLVTDNFKAVGLTHILAVSGQNVAFVLVIGGPLLRRFGFRGRFALIVGVLVLFATVTRFEPSVVRASVMTAVAAVGALVGTEVSSRRVLSLAVTGLILFDPLLVHSVAFQLSVAASAGILMWSGRIARALPGPRVVAEAVGVTASAQIAVAPLLVWLFEGVPVASLPANLVAGPAAGPVMMWGLTAGWVAGLMPPWASTVLHLPTRALLWWIDGTAAMLATAPLGELGGFHVLLLLIAGWLGLQQLRLIGRVAALAAIVVVLAAPGISAHQRSVIDIGGSFVVRSDTAALLVLDSSTRPEVLLQELRRAQVSRLDTVVSLQGGNAAHTRITMIRERHDVGRVLAPLDHRLPRAIAVTEPATLSIADVLLDVEPVGGHLDVSVLSSVDTVAW